LTLRRRNRGFTLIELITVIIIIAVISSIAVPSYARFLARAEFDKNVRKTAAMLAFARESAIQAAADAIVRFDAQTETFHTAVDRQQPQTDLPVAMQETPESNSQDVRTFNLSEDMSVSDFHLFSDPNGLQSNATGAGISELRFHEDGSADGGQFVLHSIHGYAAGIEVSQLTGKVTIVDPNAS